MLPARAVAKRFNDDEMMVLLATYERLPMAELRDIDVNSANPDCTYDDLDGAFSQCLASFLVYFLTCACDFRLASLIDYRSPGQTADQRLNEMLETADKVRTLPAQEAVALHVILEAARALPAAVNHYANWWVPDMMLRLLERPEMDWPGYGLKATL